MTETKIDIIHGHRMRTYDALNCAGLRFERVDIFYSDGSLFYSGWIQDLGLNSGPTVFNQNYENCNLDQEKTNSLDIYGKIHVDHADCTIRPATIGDIEQIIDLRFQNYFDGSYNRISAFQSLNQEIDDTNLTWVAVAGGTIIGHAYAILRPEGIAYLDDIYVHQKFRNAQVGTRLLRMALFDVMTRGIDRVELKIIGNADQCENAARFYDRLGFSVVNCGRRHDGIVEAAMGLDLRH